MRGLDLLDQAVEGPIPLAELSGRMGLTRSTTHRLANALIDRGFLTFVSGEGYRLGPKLLYLGFQAQAQADIIQAARTHLEGLATRTEHTVHLGRLDGDAGLYLHKVAGRRRVDISSRVGERQPLTSTGLGKALLMDHPPGEWRRLYQHDHNGRADGYAAWEDRMRDYVAAGYTFDLEENEDQIRCVAAPVRDASGRIVAAVSVSGAAQYMDDERMTALSPDVRATAAAISEQLGWQQPASTNRKSNK